MKHPAAPVLWAASRDWLLRRVPCSWILSVWHTGQEATAPDARACHLFEDADGTPLLFDAASGLSVTLDPPAYQLLQLRRLGPAEAAGRIRALGGLLDTVAALGAMRRVEALDLLLQKAALPPPGRFPLPALPPDAAAGSGGAPVPKSMAERAVAFLVHHAGVSADSVAWSLTNGAQARPRLVGSSAAPGVTVSLSVPAGSVPDIEHAGVCPASSLTLLLDGPQAVHEEHRALLPGRRPYPEVIREIESAKAAGRRVAVSAELSPRSPGLTSIFQHLRSLGSDEITIKPIKLPPDHLLAITESDLTSLVASYRDFAAYLCDMGAADLVEALGLLSEADYFKRFLLRVVRRVKLGYRCPAAKTMLDADDQGALYGCSSFTRARLLPIGTLDDGFDRERIHDFVYGAYVDNKPVCRDCWARYVCGGGCYYLATLRHGNPLTPDPVDCELVRFVAEISISTVHRLSREHPEAVSRALGSAAGREKESQRSP